MKKSTFIKVMQSLTLLMIIVFSASGKLSAQTLPATTCNTSSITTVTACDSFVWNGKTFTFSTVNNCMGGIQALDGSNRYYEYATVYDWDCCLFGPNAVNESGFGYLVDGHYKIKYDCNGNGIVVEATGNYAGYLGTQRNDNFGYSSNPRWKSLITDGGCCNGDGSKIFVQLDGLVKDGYTMHFTNAAGCDSAATLRLTINEKVTLGSLSAAQNPLCPGNTTTLSAIGVKGTNAQVNWYSGPGASGTFLGTGAILSNVPGGVYFARVSGACGLPVEKSIKVWGDTAKPKILCPADIMVSTSTCSRFVTTTAPVYSDNCAVKKLSWTTSGATILSSPNSGIRLLGRKVFNAGITKVVYKIVDSALNTATCSFNVMVNTTAVCLGRDDAKIVKEEPTNKVFNARLIANPVVGAFGLYIQSDVQQIIIVNAYNCNGEKVEQLKVAPNRIASLGNNYLPGCYLFEVIRGAERQILKGLKN